MKNKSLKLFLLFISIFCFTFNVNALTKSGSNSNVKLYKVKCYKSNLKGGKNPVAGCYYTDPEMPVSQTIGIFRGHTDGKFRFAQTAGLYKIKNTTTGKTDVAYCLQTGRTEPTNQNYTLKTVDLSKCDTIGGKSTDGKSIPYGACGLAEIMYQIKNAKEYKDIRQDIKSYGIVTTVMRMWITFLNNPERYDYSSTGLGTTNISSVDRDGTYFFPLSKKYNLNGEQFYGTYDYMVYNYLVNNTEILESECVYNGGKNWEVDAFRVNTKESTWHQCEEQGQYAFRINAVYKLFKYLVDNRNSGYTTAEKEFLFGGDEKTNIKVTYSGKEKASEEAAKKQIWNVKFKVNLGTAVSEQFKAKCNPEKEKGCTTYIQVKDASGNNIGYCSGNDIHDGKTCYRITKINNEDSSGKNSYVYDYVIHNYKVCDTTSKTDSYGVTMTKPKIEFKYVDTTSYSKMRIYTGTSDYIIKNYQIMATFIDDENFDDNSTDEKPNPKTGTLNGEEKFHEYEIPITDVNCQKLCDSSEACSDLSKKTDIKSSSSGATEIKDECNNSSNSGANSFEERTISDPNMACILNNCDTNETLNYNRDSELNVNFSSEGICKSYCREEVKFYVPSPVSVNAGMQFTLDLGKTLKTQKAIDDQVAEGKKLTAVVVRFTQCTTVLNGKKYNTQLNTYRDQYYKAKNDYDYPYEYRDHIIPQDEKNLASAKKSRDSICASVDSDDEYSVKKCSDANSKVSSLEAQLAADKTTWANHQNWYNNNPKKIYNLRVNKEYCLLDTSDELKSYISNINDDRVTKSTQTSLRDKVTSYGSSTSSKTKLEVSYDEDEKYSEGYNPTIGSVTKQVKLDEKDTKKKESVKWCTSNCYEYNKTTTESTCNNSTENSFKDTSNDIRVNDLYEHKYSKYSNLKLKGYVKNIENIYSTMIVKYQTDYYMNKSYSYENFTGIVKDSNTVSGNESYHKLSENSYPVSIERDTESSNNIKYKFIDLYPTKKSSQVTFENFEYKCYYNVYNTIKKNNCSITNDAKEIDITQCSNKCFTMTSDGHSTVDSNCVSWNTNNTKKGLGIVYRNVSLKNMFPVARGNRSNWYSADSVKMPYLRGTVEKSDNINVGSLVNITEESGNNIYNDDHLEVSYKLTTETIKSIKEYNKNAQSNGGYLNETLIDCGDDKVTHPSGATYYKCKGSTFLNMLDDTNGWNAKVGGN